MFIVFGFSLSFFFNRGTLNWARLCEYPYARRAIIRWFFIECALYAVRRQRIEVNKREIFTEWGARFLCGIQQGWAVYNIYLTQTLCAIRCSLNLWFCDITSKTLFFTYTILLGLPLLWIRFSRSTNFRCGAHTPLNVNYSF